MADGIVQLAADGPGKRIDTSELTRADGTVVERQRMVIGGTSDPNVTADLDAAGNLPVDTSQLLIEAKRQTALLTAIVLQLGSVTGVTPNIDDLLEG